MAVRSVRDKIDALAAMKNAAFVGNLPEALEVDDAGIIAGTADDKPRLVLYAGRSPSS